MNLLTHSLDTVSHGVRTGSKPESKPFQLSHNLIAYCIVCFVLLFFNQDLELWHRNWLY